MFHYTDYLFFSHWVISNSLRPHGVQCTRPPCLLPSPRVFPSSCALSQWCYPTVSSGHPLLLLPSLFSSISIFSSESVVHIRWSKYWSFSFSISPSLSNQGWFPLGLTGLISVLFKGLSRIFSRTTVQKHQFFGAHPSLWSNSHICTWLLERL